MVSFLSSHKLVSVDFCTLWLTNWKEKIQAKTKHLLSPSLGIRNLGATELGGSSSGSLTRLQSSCPGLAVSFEGLTGGGFTSKLANMAIDRPQNICFPY